MGIVARQSIKGTIATYVGVAVGIVTTFFVQTKYLTTEEIGPSAVILVPKKVKSATVFTVSSSICNEMMGPDAMILVL